MKLPFLSATWKKLIHFNFKVEAGLLEPYLPRYTSIDEWNGDTYLSLVAFMFCNTRLFSGIKIPFHVNFPESNFRFYAKRIVNGETRKGVVFIREIIPRLAISTAANIIYREHYRTLPMRYLIKNTKDSQVIEYHWEQENRWHLTGVKTKTNTIEFAPESKEEFITKRNWGFTKVSSKTTLEYEVLHPDWLLYEHETYKLDVDFGSLYGQQFGILNDEVPDSIMVAEGSPVQVMFWHKAKP